MKIPPDDLCDHTGSSDQSYILVTILRVKPNFYLEFSFKLCGTHPCFKLDFMGLFGPCRVFWGSVQRNMEGHRGGYQGDA